MFVFLLLEAERHFQRYEWIHFAVLDNSGMLWTALLFLCQDVPSYPPSF